MIRRDHGVELAADRANKDGVGGKGSEELRAGGRGTQHQVVLVAEPTTFAPVRIERAERDARIGDPEPLA